MDAYDRRVDDEKADEEEEDLMGEEAEEDDLMIEHDPNNGGAKELLRTLGQDIREATREVGLWSSLLAMAVSMMIAYWTLVGRLSAHSKRGHFARQSTKSYSAQDPLQPLGDRSVPNDQIQGILHDRHMYSTSMVEAADVPLYFQTLARAGPEGHHRMPKAWYGAATFGISASDPNGDLQSVPENARMNELLRNDLAALVPPPTTILPWQLESRDGLTTDGACVRTSTRRCDKLCVWTSSDVALTRHACHATRFHGAVLACGY